MIKYVEGKALLQGCFLYLRDAINNINNHPAHARVK